LHVHLTTTKKSYLDNDKHIEANAQDMKALKHTLSKEYFSLISHFNSAFAVWNTLTSPKEQVQHILEREPRRDESEQTCYMVQGNNPLEVNSDTHLDDCVSSSNDHDSIVGPKAFHSSFDDD